MLTSNLSVPCPRDYCIAPTGAYTYIFNLLNLEVRTLVQVMTLSNFELSLVVLPPFDLIIWWHKLSLCEPDGEHFHAFLVTTKWKNGLRQTLAELRNILEMCLI